MSKTRTGYLRLLATDQRELDSVVPALPEASLLAAVLEQAVLDLIVPVCNIKNNKQIAREVRQWVLSDEELEWSFVWVCTHLQLCPVILRQYLKPFLTPFGPKPKIDRKNIKLIRLRA